MAKSKKRVKKQPTQSVAASHDKLTWKYWIIGAVAVLLTVGFMILVSQLVAKSSIPTYTLNGNMLTRDSDGAIYMKASGMYMSRYQGDTECGKAEDLLLYPVTYRDKYGLQQTQEGLLTDETGAIYYSQMVTLPDLKNFHTEAVYVCLENKGEVTMALSSLTNQNTPDADNFVAEVLAQERYGGAGSIGIHTYTLFLNSSVYPYLYYKMYLVACDNGDFYVYNDDNKTSIAVSSHWFSDLSAKETTGVDSTTGTPESSDTPVSSGVPETENP